MHPKPSLTIRLALSGWSWERGNDKLRHSRNNAFRGGSYAAMMNDGAAARKEVLKARVRDVKHAGRARSLGRIQADEQASQVEFPADLKSSGLEMLNIKIG